MAVGLLKNLKKEETVDIVVSVELTPRTCKFATKFCRHVANSHFEFFWQNG